MDKVSRKEKLTLQVGVTLAAGMLSIVPVTYGAPVLDHVVTPQTKVEVSQQGKLTDVSSSVKNNVIDWKDFSVQKGETVRFDKGAKTNNYLNIVSGGTQSQINGTIQGGKDVYIVNPKGVVMGKDAQVDVGNLYVSTTKQQLDVTQYLESGASPLVNTSGSAAADVVNMGKISADTVHVEGGTIQFLDVADISAKGKNVVLQANDAIELGHAMTSSASTTKGIRRARSSSDSAYVTSIKPENYTNVSNESELNAVKNDLTKNYWLTDNIDLNGAEFTPIGGDTAYSGTFDGNFFEISNYKVSSGTYGGLFGNVSGTIQHLGVTGADISGVNFAGGIAGKLTSKGKISQSYVKVSSIQSKNGKPNSSLGAGGIVGVMDNGTVSESYVTGLSSANTTAGGIAGYLTNSSTIENVYTTAFSQDLKGIYNFLGDDQSSAKYAYTSASKIADSTNLNKTYLKTTSEATQYAEDYEQWKEDGKSLVSSEGGEDTKWRIYEGRSLPLLRCFLKANGTVNATYDYTNGETSGHADGTTNPEITYNHEKVQITNIHLSGKTEAGTIISQDLDDAELDANVDWNSTTKTARARSVLTQTQDGYDVIGTNITIVPRTVSISTEAGTDGYLNKAALEKTYDGTTNVDKDKLLSILTGNTTTEGIISGDETVTINNNGLNGTYSQADVGDSEHGVYVTLSGGPVIKNAVKDSEKNTYYHNYAIDDDAKGLKADFDGLKLRGVINQAARKVSVASGSVITREYQGHSVYDVADDDKLTADKLGKDNENPYLKLTDIVMKTTQTGDTQTETKDDVYLTVLSPTGQYVDRDGDTDTPTGAVGDHKVKYEGLVLGGTKAGNYKLVDANDTDTVIYQVQTNGVGEDIGKDTGGSFYADGHINPKNIAMDSFALPTGTATKEYDNTPYLTKVGDTDIAGQSLSSTDVITGDRLAFTVTNTTDDKGNTYAAYFSKDNSKVKDKGDNYDITYHVTISGEDASNYTLGGQAIQNNGTADVTGQSGSGSITPRILTLEKVAGAASVDKEYDGTKNVYVGSDKHEAITLADGLVQYAEGSHQLLDDGTSLTITGKYDDPNVLVDTATQKPAARTITYTVQVKGDTKGNYAFVTADQTQQNISVEKAGIIQPKKLTVTINKELHKTYDGSAVAGKQQTDTLTADDITLNGLVVDADKTGSNGVLTDDILASINENGHYGYLSGTDFQEDGHVHNPDGTKTKVVRYTGLTSGSTNYTFQSDTADASGYIDPLTVTSVNVVLSKNIGKVYDGQSDLATKADGQNAAGTATDYIEKVTTETASGTQLDLDLTDAIGHYVDAGGSNTANVKNVSNAKFSLKLDESGDYQIADSLKTNGWVEHTLTDAERGDKTISITPRTVYAHVTNPETLEKTYDGKTAIGVTGDAAVTIDGLLSDLDHSTNTSSGKFHDKNVAYKDNIVDLDHVTTKDIDYAISLNDGDKVMQGNYNVYKQGTKDLLSYGTPTSTDKTKYLFGVGKINPLQTDVSFVKIQKTFDNNTSLDNVKARTAGETALTGTVENIQKHEITGGGTEADDVTVTPVADSSAFTDSAVGTTTINYTFTLGGSDRNNYFLKNAKKTDTADTYTAQQDGNAILTLKLTDADIERLFNLADNEAITKVYDGKRDVAYTHADTDEHEGEHWGTQAGSATAEQYFKSLTIGGVTLELGKDYTISKAEYNSANVADATKAEYTFALQGDTVTNFDFSGLSSDIYKGSKDGVNGQVFASHKGKITQKNITADLTNTPLDSTIWKQYDGTAAVRLNDTTDVDADFFKNKIALTGLITGENAVTTGSSTAVYADANGNVQYGEDGTTPIAQAITYTVKLDGDHAGNYNVLSDTLTGEGTIKPRELKIEVVGEPFTRTYNGKDTIKQDAINGTNIQIQTQNNETLNLDFGSIKGYYGTEDSTAENFVRNGDVQGQKGKTEEYKNIQLTGLTTALENATGSANVKNYTIDDTAFFAASSDKGKITRLDLTQDDFKTPHFDAITKEYDGNEYIYKQGDSAEKLENAKSKFHLAIDHEKVHTDEDVDIAYELVSAVYNDGQKDVTTDNVGVTYKLGGIEEKEFNNYNMSEDLLSQFVGKTYNSLDSDEKSNSYGGAVGSITPRKLYISLDSLKDKPVTKDYDGKTVITDVRDWKSLIHGADFTYGDGAVLDVDALYNSPDVARDKDGKVAHTAIKYVLGVGGTGKAENYAFYDAATKGKDTEELLKDNTIFDAEGGLIKPLLVSFQVKGNALTRTYDGTADITAAMINDAIDDGTISLSGLLNKGEDLTLGKGYITGRYGTNDSTKTEFKANGDVNGDEAAKAIQLTGIQQALNHATSTKDTKGSNYEFTIGDTATYTVGDNKGSITRMKLASAEDIKTVFDTITKVYDGTRDVTYTHRDKEGEYWAGSQTGSAKAEDYLKSLSIGGIELHAFDTDGKTPKDFTVSAAYNSENVADAKQADYTLTLADNIANNFDFSKAVTEADDTVRYDVGSHAVLAHPDATITAKFVQASLTDTPADPITKQYDGTTDLVDDDGHAIDLTNKVALKGLIQGDTVALDMDKLNAHYAYANVAYDDEGKVKAQDVFYTAHLKDTAAAKHAANYIINPDKDGKAVETLKGTGIINRRQLNVVFGDQTKTYDGNNLLYKDSTSDWINRTGTEAITHNPLKGYGTDDVSLTEDAISGTFDSAGTDATTVNYTGIAFKNGDMTKNYELVDRDGKTIVDGKAAGNGTITPYAIQDDQYVFAFDKVTKDYDGTDKVIDADSFIRKTDAEKGTQSPFIDLNGNGLYDADDGETLVDYTIQDTGTHFADANSHYGATQDVTYAFTVKNEAAGFMNLTSLARTTDGVINPRKTTYTIVNPSIKKTYDGTKNVVATDADGRTTVLTGEQLVHYNNIVAGEDANTINTATAEYGDKNAGDWTVTYHLTSQGGNYQVVDADGNSIFEDTSTTGTIDKRQLDLYVDATDKTYDGDAVVKKINGAVFGTVDGRADTGLVDGEILTPYTDGSAHSIAGTYGVIDADGSFRADANVNRLADNSVGQKALAYTNLQDALANSQSTGTKEALASNYTIADTAYFKEGAEKGRILPLAITADAVKAKWGTISKEYDGTDDVVALVKKGDTTINDPSSKLTLYYQSDVGDKKLIEIGYTLNQDGANYTQSDQGKDITVNYTLQSVDKPSFTNDSGFGNYTMDDDTVKAVQSKTWQTTGTITPKTLTVTVLKADGQDKIYDGTRNADAGNISVTGFVDKDIQTVKPTVVAYYEGSDAKDNGKNAGVDKTVKYEISLDGNTKGNYVFAKDDDAVDDYTEREATGTIAKRKVYVQFKGDAVSGINKTYDGTKDIDGSYGDYIMTTKADDTTGLVGGDDAAFDGSTVQAHYASENVAHDADGNVTTQDVYFTNFNLTGTDADNYELMTPSLTGSGTITPRALQVSLKESPHKIYDGTTEVKGTSADGIDYASMQNVNVDTTNLVTNDTLNKLDEVNVTLDGTPTYDSQHANTDPDARIGVTYKLKWDNANYTLERQPLESQTTVTSDDSTQTAVLHDAAKGTIEGRVLTIDVISPAEKTYDGTKAVADAASHLSIGNLAKGDTIDMLGFTAKGTYSSANAADSESADTTDRTVTYDLAALNTDYIIEDPEITGTGVIRRKGLTVTAEPVSRLQYDLRGLPTSYNGSVTGWVSGEEGQSTAFTFHTDPADNVTTEIPGNYGIYGWYNGAQSGNFGLNYTFDQDAANATAFEVVNLKEYHDRITPAHQATTTTTGYHEASPTDFGAFYRKPAETVAYSGGTSAGAINKAADQAAAGTSESISGTQAYTPADTGSQVIGQIGIENTNVVNIDAAEAVNLQSDEIVVENTDNGAGIAIYAENPEGEIAIRNEA